MDDFVGRIELDLNEIPKRMPTDSPLAPVWYRLEDKKGEKISNGELMLLVGNGTQADDAFSYAYHFDSINSSIMLTSSIATHCRSKVYHPPRLWYLRVNIIRAQDLIVYNKGRIPNYYVEVQLGTQIWKTKPIQTQDGSTLWNEEGLFVAAEPFDENLIITVEDEVGPNKRRLVGW